MKRSSAAVAGKSQLLLRILKAGKHGRLPNSSLGGVCAIISGVTTAVSAAGATGEDTLLPEVAGDMSRATEEAFGVNESSLDSDGMVNLAGMIFPSSTGVNEPSLDVAGMKLAGLMLSSTEQQ